MKRFLLFALLSVVLCLPAWSQKRGDLNGDGQIDVTDVGMLIDIVLGKLPSDGEPVTQTFTVNGVSFTMVAVEGGTFTMGATKVQGNDASYDEKPSHQVTLSGYSIGQTEVTQELWQTVMGSNPSSITGDLHRPVENVSWDDCQEFITKLNQLTGKTFRLPTEAEWEYAARGGNKSQGYKYSGSNTIDDVAWYASNASHPVGTKAPNELGLYDMSGNVYEWCYDWYGEEYYRSSPSNNPTGPSSGVSRVNRGGCWSYTAKFCRVTGRNGKFAENRYNYLGLRLAWSQKRGDLNGDGQVDVTDVGMLIDMVLGKLPSDDDPATQTFTVNGVSFKMIAVKGGTFTMGATAEQGSDAESDENPAHQVTLSDYSIGATEVTQELWQAVMGSNPSYFTGDLQRPVEEVSWNTCQQFITKLNQLTGKNFRLPTEAEWEYAARGGNKSQGFKYSGSNNIGDVAWYKNNNNDETHPVGTKAPNELGLYDMSGNVWEWCQDWYDSYSSNAQTNPTGPASGSELVYRGGGWSGLAGYCRVSNRSCDGAVFRSNDRGLRLAL